MPTDASTTRRQFLGSLVALGAAAGVVVGRGSAHATGDAVVESVTGPAEALERAVRVPIDVLPADGLGFPVRPGEGLIVLNNFGGFSVSSGSCSHIGIDVFPTTDAVRTLLSCVDGVIDGQRINDGPQGNAWILIDENNVRYRYHHIDEFEPGLEVGSPVRRGQPIATMGTSGNANSAHLHFEVRLDGRSTSAVDPIPLFSFPIENVEVRAPTGCA